MTSLARRLIAAGIPVVVVPPGDVPPPGWNEITADQCDISHYRPGIDALAMVGGHGIDGVDVDTKKKGGSEDHLPRFAHYGRTRTPSDGLHLIVPSTGYGKIQDWETSLGYVGDYVGGRPDGSGRMLLFLPDSVRSKYPDGGYVEEVPWDIEACLAAEPDPALLRALEEAGASSEARESHVVSGPRRDAEAGLHPYAEAAIRAETNRLEQLQILGWDGPGWDNTCFQVACNLIEFANSPWAGYPLEEAEMDFLVACPRDENFTAANHIEKWQSAMKRVGQSGRDDPDDSGFTVVSDGKHPIFDATSTLQHIRTAAHARLVGSGALLCYVLGRVLAEVPPEFVLPAVVGSKASLNLGFAFVGKSGDGKSATSSVSAELLGINQAPIETGLGSGEGLMESFLEPALITDPNDPSKTIKGKQLVDPATRILEIDEIGQLGAVGKRDGSSMLAILRSGLTGGALKSSNATLERRRSIEKGSYRLVTFAGIQPELSGVLLQDEGVGTPQRFVWVSVVDHTIDRSIPEWPGKLDWDAVHLEFADHHVIRYPDHIKDVVIETRFAQVQKGLDPLKGHQLLTQLKVAVAVAMLHKEIDVTDQWWDIAGHIMNWSMKEQQRCREALVDADLRRAHARGKGEAEVEIAKSDRLSQAEEEALPRLKENLFRAVKRAGDEGIVWKDLKKVLTYKRRHLTRGLLDQLVDEGKIKLEQYTARSGQEATRAYAK